MPLRIAAKVPKGERGYFKEQLEPKIDGREVQLTGEVNDQTKEEFLANAAALLFPIDWPEPFGLVMIEAMACGTPVIAYRHGSVPEVIDEGVTGFVVDSEEEAGARRSGAWPRRDRPAPGARLKLRALASPPGGWPASMSLLYGTPAEVVIAIDKCKSDPGSSIPVLEKQLKAARLSLPPRG
jgi:hypothetical protein